MRIATCSAAALVVCLLSATTTLAVAPEFEAVLTFDLPAATSVSRTDPACQRALDIGKLLSDPQWHAALVDVDAHATRVLGSTAAVLTQIGGPRAGHADPVIRTSSENSSRCESGCVVLPEGARIKQILLSDRRGGKGFSILEADDAPRAREHQRMQARSNWSIAGPDFGYQSVAIDANDRVTCITAKNWSLAEPTTQVVRVVFGR